MRNKVDRKIRRQNARIESNVVNEFIAVDGEGITLDNGEHLYTLLAASDGSFIEDRHGLDSKSCLEFLIGLKVRYPKAIFVSFYFKYDVNMILKNVDRRAVAQLADKDYCFLVDGEDNSYSWKVAYIPGKMFTIIRYDNTGKTVVNSKGKIVKDRSRNKSVIIYDVFGFFQGSFVSALRSMKVGTESELELLVGMKGSRSDFDADNMDEVRRYNHLECRLLVEMMVKLNQAMQDAGIYLKRWYGAGAVANELNRVNDVKSHIELPSDERVYKAVMSGYFGGRIQAIKIGDFKRKVYGHDLISAYPSTLVDLPSLKGGTWRAVNEYCGIDKVGIYKVGWDIDSQFLIQPFPHRQADGSIEYPSAGEGWYYMYEVDVAVRHFGAAVTVTGGYVLDVEDCSKPFGFVAGMYERRREFKRDGNHAELALKLGMNSLYGKCAQGVSAGGKRPAYQCYIWAGLITSHTRARMLDAAMSKPESVISFATDGLFSTEQLINEVPGLGGYEVCEYDRFFIVKPGIYCAWRGSERIVGKVRGFRVSEVDFDDVINCWEGHGIHGRISRSARRFVGMKSAGQLSTSTTWTKWQDYDKTMYLMPTKGFPRDCGSGIVGIVPGRYPGVESVEYGTVEYDVDVKDIEDISESEV